MNEINNYKFPCGVVRDLLPLYRDNVCGEESRRIVEAHLAECAECPKILEQMEDGSVEELLSTESNSVLIIHRKKERRTAVTAGLITSGLLFIPMVVCLICNLATGHGLSWFFIVLTSLMTAASVTALPMLAGRYRFSKVFAGFLISLFLLLLSCCLYTGGDWLLVAAVPTVFGVSLLAFPFVVRELPLPDGLKNRKTLITISWDVLWLLATLAVCCVYTNGKWFSTAAIGSVFGLSVVLMPILIRQIPLPDILKNQKALVVMIWDTVWLYALVIDCAKYIIPNGGVLLYLQNSIIITSMCLLVPWIIFILIRYFKLHVLIKTGSIMILSCVFAMTANDLISLVYRPRGMYSPSVLRGIIEVISGLRPSDTSFWIMVNIFGGLLVIGIVLVSVGVVLSSKKHRK